MITRAARDRAAAERAPLCTCGHHDVDHREYAHGEAAYRPTVFPCSACDCTGYTPR